MKKYIVCWVSMVEEEKEGTDHYRTFTEGESSEENLSSAQHEYDLLKDSDGIYTCNLCEIIESTDYLIS